MKSLTIKDILLAGTSDINQDYLNAKIKLSNHLAIFLAVGVAIPFIGIDAYYFPSLVFIPIVGLVVCISVIILNNMQLTYISRVVVSLLPILLVSTFNACLTGPGDNPITGMFVIKVAFSLIPFVVFDWKEKWYLIVLCLFNAHLVLLSDWYNSIYQSGIDAEVLRTGWLAPLTTAIGILVAFACVGNYAYEAYNAEIRNSRLLQEAEQKNLEVETSRTELEEKITKIDLAQEEEKKRDWRAKSMEDINRILREERENIEDTYSELVSSLVKIMDAAQCGLFEARVDEDEDPYLHLSACYAFERKKYLKKEIQLGEGLLGQTYLEKHTTYLTDIPQSYTNIQSGLGGAKPNVLLIVPMVANDVVEGILEIASFNRCEDYQIKFLEEAGNTIASAMRNIRITSQMKAYIEVAKENTEEMRAQEEEMRQNNEELQATQEQLQRSMADIEKKNAKTSAILEKTNDGVIIANQASLIMEASPVAQKIFSYNESDLLYHGIDILIPNFTEQLESLESKKSKFAKAKDNSGNELTIKLNRTFFHQGEDKFSAFIINDVTEEEKMKAQIHEQFLESKLFAAKTEAMLKETTDGIITISSRGVIEYFNPTAEKIFGYSAVEVIGKKIETLMEKDHAENHDQYLDNYHTTGEKKVIGKGRKVRGKRKDGTSMLLDLRVNEFEVEGQKYFAGVLQDITEEVAMKAELEKNDRDRELALAKTEAMLKETTDGIITISSRGVIEYFNPTAEKIFGYSAVEVIGKKIETLMEKDHAENHDQYLHNYHTTGEKKVIGKGRKVRGKRKDGTSMLLDLRVNEFEVEGQKYFAGVLQDITEEVAMKAELEKKDRDRELALAKTEAMLKETTDGIIIITNNGFIDYVNPTVEKIFQHSSKELLGKKIETLMGKQHSSKHDQYLENYHTTGNKKVIGKGRRVPGRRKDGTEVMIDLRVNEIRVQDQVYYAGVLSVVNEKAIEKDLQQHKEQLMQKEEEVKALKSQLKKLNVK